MDPVTGPIDIHHRLDYSLSRPSGPLALWLRLLPVDRPGLTVETASLTLVPLPQNRHTLVDDAGNRHDRIILTGPVQRVVIASHSRVRLIPAPGGLIDGLLVDDLSGTPGHWAGSGPLTPFVPDLTALARTALVPGRALAPALSHLVDEIGRGMRFAAGATTVATDAATAWAGGVGVCQDFSHILLAALRGMGVACRYAAGYLAPVASGQWMGAEPHAWVEVATADGRWITLDPANGRCPAGGVITVSVGRDYDDVRPVEGGASGDVAVAMTGEVELRRLGAPADPVV